MASLIEKMAIVKRELEVPTDMPVQQAVSRAYELMGWQLGETPLSRAVDRLFLQVSPDSQGPGPGPGPEQAQGTGQGDAAAASSEAAHDISREGMESGAHLSPEEEDVEQGEEEHSNDGDRGMKIPEEDHEKLLKGVKWGNRTDCTAYIKRINLEHFNKRVHYVKNGLAGESGYVLGCTCSACR